MAVRPVLKRSPSLGFQILYPFPIRAGFGRAVQQAVEQELEAGESLPPIYYVRTHQDKFSLANVALDNSVAVSEPGLTDRKAAAQKIVIEVTPPAQEEWTNMITAGEQWAITPGGTLRIIHPLRIVTRGERTSRVEMASTRRGAAGSLNDRWLEAISFRAEIPRHRFERSALAGGRCPRNGRSYLRKLSRLAFLTPDIQQSTVEGRQPPGLTLSKLLGTDIPLGGDEQRRILGLTAYS